MTTVQMTGSHYVGRTRIYYGERQGGKKPHGMRIEGGEWKWYATAQAVSNAVEKMRKEYGKGKRKYTQQERFDTIVCACGCGQTGTVAYGTRKPRFLNAEHKRAADNARRRDKRLAARKAKETAAAKKASKAAERKARKAEAAARVHMGVEGGGAGEGEGASPSPRKGRAKGMYGSQGKPTQSKKRASAITPAEG